MIRFAGILTGILITTALYFLYLNLNLRTSPENRMTQAFEKPLPQLPAEDSESGIVDIVKADQASVSELPEPEPETSLDSTAATAVFWKPFHSHYSASGFARRMSLATGIEIKVIATDEHRYEVAFNYTDEHQHAAKTSIIENITGLDLDRGAKP